MRNFVARPYQEACLQAIREQFSKGKRRVLVEQATGAGKTIQFCMIADMVKEKGGKTLILCNRDNLATQAALKYKAVTGEFPSVEKADEKGSRHQSVVVGSIQTMQKDRLLGWSKDHFTMVITDEVHGAAAPTFKAVLNHFDKAWHIGFSATVERADGQGVGWFYETCDGEHSPFAYRIGVFDLIELGWLVPLKFKKIPVPIALDEKLATKKRLTEEEEGYALEPHVNRLITTLADMIRDSHSLVFLPECTASLAASQLLTECGLNARHIQGAGKSKAGYMHDWEVEELMKWFETREAGRVLTNASLLTTGYDNPILDTVAIIRLIKSTGLWTQIVGRVTRPMAHVDKYATPSERKDAIAASEKPVGTILDLLIQSDNHNIAQPSCLISTLKAERQAIDAKVNNFFEGETDIEGLKSAMNEVKMDAKAEALRKVSEQAANAAAKMKAKADKSSKLPYIQDIIDRDFNESHKPATAAFLGYIRGLGFSMPRDRSYTARQLFRIKERYEKFKQ